MNLKRAFSAAILAGVVLIQASAQTTVSGGWGLNSPFNRLYDNTTVVTFSGTVIGMQTSPPMNGMDAGTSILVKSANGGTSLVHLGPFWFVNNLRPAIRVKDKVTVTGSKIAINNRTAILASTVAIGNKLLILRDAAGVPVWAAVRPQGAVDVSSLAGAQSLNGEIVDVRQLANGDSAVVIRTPTGDVTIDVGPQWFISRQNMNFNTGDLINLSGAQVQMNTMGPVFAPNYIVSGPNVLILRSAGGQPVWWWR